MEDAKQKALAKIAKEYESIDSAEGEIALFLESWVNFDEHAAELILSKKKSLKGAFSHMREVARKKHNEKNASYLSHREEKEATMSYYGVEDPDALLEDGLMYAFYQNCASRWAPPEEKAAEIRETQKKEDGLKLDFNELFG